MVKLPVEIRMKVWITAKLDDQLQQGDDEAHESFRQSLENAFNHHPDMTVSNLQIDAMGPHNVSFEGWNDK